MKTATITYTDGRTLPGVLPASPPGAEDLTG